MACPCTLSPFCLHTGFTQVSGEMTPEQSWTSQCIAVSAQTLLDLPQMTTLWWFGLVSNKIRSSGATSHWVCTLKSHACGAPISTDSSQIWFVCESRCQAQMPSHQKFSRSIWRCFKPWWAFCCRCICFNYIALKIEGVTFSPPQYPNTAILLLTNMRGNRAEREEKVL